MWCLSPMCVLSCLFMELATVKLSSPDSIYIYMVFHLYAFSMSLPNTILAEARTTVTKFITSHTSLVCVSSCLFLLLAWLKRFSQYWHLHGLLPVCIISCWFLLPAWLKYFSQYWHLCGFLSVFVCIISCLFLLLWWLKNFSQYWYLNRFFSLFVSIISCLFLLVSCLKNFFPYWLLYGLSPLFIFQCILLSRTW